MIHSVGTGNSDDSWKAHAEKTVCQIHPHTGAKIWHNCKQVFEHLFLLWIECAESLEPRKVLAKISAKEEKVKDVEIPSLDENSQEFISWAKKWEVNCPLYTALIQRFSGYEINRRSLCIITKGFRKGLKAVMLKKVEGFEANKTLRSRTPPKKGLPLANKVVSLLLYSQNHGSKNQPKESMRIINELDSPEPDSRHHEMTPSMHPLGESSLRDIVSEHLLVSLLAYVRKFIKKTDANWQCINKVPLYVVEVENH